MPALSHGIDFREHVRAEGNLARLASELPVGVQSRIVILLRNSPDPDTALHYLCRLHDEKLAAFHWLLRSPTSLQFLVAVFSYSQFLSEQLLQTPEWLEPLPASGDLHRVLSAEEFEQRLSAQLGSNLAPEFALFRREQILRILVRDVLGFGSLSDITEELSNLADAMIEVACRRLRAALARKHGDPRTGFCVMALGKLGGRELNYSSDVDLMFLYGENGRTTGREPVSYEEFFKSLCIQLTEMLSTHTAAGMCYRVDLRLRPEGAHGEVCLSLDVARAYYQKRARDWELQMLIKGRPAAGDRATGRALLEHVEPLSYSSSTDFSAVEAVSESRVRISEKLSKRRGAASEFDVKLAPGGIRDIEFLVQCLQRLYGREQWVRQGGTLLALFRLRDKNLLSEIEHGRLASAYQFLRNLEHRLQVEHDLQTHTLPSSPEQLELLARKMPPAVLGSAPTAAALVEQLRAHCERVREIYDRVVHSRHRETAAPAVEVKSQGLRHALAVRAPGLLFALLRSPMKHGAKAFEHFIEKILPMPEYVDWLDQEAKLRSYTMDLFEQSPYFAELLNRKPDLLTELKRLNEAPVAATRYGEMPSQLADATLLRQFFNREMLRIQASSICLGVGIFETLKQTSALVDCAVATAYRMAVELVTVSNPPVSSEYRPSNQMMVIALGRLGMQEYDLGSDADLLFVLPDQDQSEELYWTRVAEKIIDILTAYTGDGVMFPIDTRLRPSGREGQLVQLECTYKEYFEKIAQSWEGITYMKSRTVAGNMKRGPVFLEELQGVDWRHHGQTGRSRQELREMRHRLERELGDSNPLKAGPGGYYDIDFSLMYLRLKSAGYFFEVLNTPERIEVIEKMGHLDREDAAFLLEAATFYRAIDHGLRLTSGHAEGTLPVAQKQLEMLAGLIARWTPKQLGELAGIEERTRKFFGRVFGGDELGV
jgi:glutamate-ammonia-ligase adenylyltransferase